MFCGVRKWSQLFRAGDRIRTPTRRSPGIELLESRSLLALLGEELFPANNAWNQKIGAAPVAANSAAIINNIVSNYGDGRLHPDFGQDSNTSDALYGIPYNVVHGTSTSKSTVVIDAYASESDLLPVPIPPSVVLEGDYQNGPRIGVDNRGDSHLIVFDVDNNMAYEFFRASRPSENADGKWHADQETVWDMNTNMVRTLGYTSADAAGLSILAGLARPDEGLPVSEGGQGVIDHAIRMTLQNSLILDQFIYPASHTANPGNTNTAIQPPMGIRFRLKNNVDISQLNPESKIIAQAMKDYGLIVADNGSNFFFTGASRAVNASNQETLTWNDADIQDSTHGLKSLHFSNFEVVDLTPQVTGLSVHSGEAGTSVTVTGQNFSGAAGHLQVLFGSAPATSLTVVDDTHVVAIAPSGSGTVDVQVQSGITTSPNSDNIKNTIFGYGISNVVAEDRFTFGTISSGVQVGNVTSTKPNGAYTVGTVLEVTVEFSAPVTVTGTPQLQLETGNLDRFVNYFNGSGSSTLTFRYTVQSGDTSDDLDYTGTGALTLNGGTIKDAGGRDATLTLAAPGGAGSLGFNKSLVIDTSAPSIMDVATSNLAESGITVAWTTSEAADTQIEYGTSTDYGFTSPLNSSLVASHTVNISGLEAATTYHFRVHSRDAAGNLALSGDYYFTTPPGLVLSNQTIAENSPPNSLVGTLTPFDGNSLAPHTFTLANSAAGRFKIVGNQVQVANGSLLDYELAKSHNITVEVSSVGGPTYQKSFTVTLTNVNEITGFDVQKGLSERSYVRYVDILFESTNSLGNLLSGSRVQLTRFDLDGTSNPTLISLAGKLSVVGNTVALNFGPQGIGGNRNSSAGDGYYRLSIDQDGDGRYEATRSFYRLFGDVNGDRIVDDLDISLIADSFGKKGSYLNADVNGDGVVNSTDRKYANQARGHFLAANLILDD
jgi:hypothetical protein